MGVMGSLVREWVNRRAAVFKTYCNLLMIVVDVP